MSLVRGLSLSLSLSSLKWVSFKWWAQKHPRNEKPQHWPQDFSADSLPFFNAICDQSDRPKWPLTSDSNRSCGRWTILKKHTKRITWFSQRIFPLILPVTIYIGPACLFGQGNGLVMFRELFHILWISTRYFQEKNTTRQRLGTKASMRLGFHMWHFTHFTQSNFNPFKISFKISFKIFPTSHEHESSTVDFYRGSGFPLPGDISRIPMDPIYVWWLPIYGFFGVVLKGTFTGTPLKMMGNTMVSDRFSLNFSLNLPWPFCAPQTMSSGRFTQLPLAPHGADQRCLTPVVSTVLSHVLLVAFADSIHI